MLTHNRFNTYMVLVFGDLNGAQVYKMPYRNSLNDEIEVDLSSDYLKLIKPIEHMKDYHIREPNDENFLFEIDDKNYIYVGDKVVSFETNDKLKICSSKLDSNDVKYPNAYGGEKIYFMLHRKYILIQEFESATENDEYQYIYEKTDELKGDNITDEKEGIVEYGNDFTNCKLLLDKIEFVEKIEKK